MTGQKKQLVARPQFIKKFVQSGLSYEHAELAYRAMITVLEDGVAARAKIHFAGVGALDPMTLMPREITMGFKRTKEGVINTKRSFILGVRTRYKFRVYPTFGRAHDLCA
jgi:hypothetical protein